MPPQRLRDKVRQRTDEEREDDRSFRDAARSVEIQQRGGAYHDRILLPNSLDSSRAAGRAIGRPGALPIKRT